MDTQQAPADRITRRSEMSTIAVSPGFTVRRTPARPASNAVRLTRRGRVLLALVFLGVLLGAFVVLGATSAATGEAGDPVPTRMVVVHEGDTLWGIAGEVAAPGEVRAMVHRIQELNAMAGSGVFIGQQIAVPVG